ncbi:MAG TPA: hypothetical protein VH592_13415 [Gemmataceae bacterium]
MPDSEVFHSFVFDGRAYSAERIEQAVRTVQRKLSSAELNRVNDALLSRLHHAKKAHRRLSKKEMLDDPGICTLVNTLALVNQAWITTVIADTIQERKHLRGFTVDEVYSTALTGAGAVGGVMNAILQYDYKLSGVDAFTTYLARAITNSLLVTPKEKKTYKRVETRTRSIHKRDEDAAEPSWVDRTAPRPETAAINRDLLEVVRSVIPDLPTQQRDTAAWMIERILETGELPMAREAAGIQRPRVSRERGRQIMEKTINTIRARIEAHYPQLAEQGINGWDEFKEAFRTRSVAQNAGRNNGRAGSRA